MAKNIKGVEQNNTHWPITLNNKDLKIKSILKFTQNIHCNTFNKLFPHPEFILQKN